jgi:hypothetical protein
MHLTHPTQDVEGTRQASAEDIEVTLAMEMAGMLALDAYDPDFNDRETAVRVYRDMERVRRATRARAKACSGARPSEPLSQSIDRDH